MEFRQAQSGHFGDWGMSMVVRAAGDPSVLIGPVRAEIQTLNDQLPSYSIRSMDRIIGDSVVRRRFAMLLLGLFGGVAVLFSGIGIYGVIAYSVRLRTQELGIRMALGAQQRSIFSSVVSRGMLLTLTGMVLGLAGALALARLMTGFLYGVSPADPLVLAVVSTLLLSVALLASYLPARRATRIDPMAALRDE